MDLRQIEYFLLVAETRNFSEASERLGVAQPTISKAVQRLEDELGLLIYRDGKDTRLTALARKLMSEFETILESAQDVRAIARSHSTAAQVDLRIGLSTSFGPNAFERFLLSFMQTHEDVRISILEVCPLDGCKALLNGQLDAMIGFELKDNPKVSCAPLFCEPCLLALPSDHRLVNMPTVSIGDLDGERFIDLVDCEMRKTFLDRVRRDGIDLPNHVSCHREDWVQSLVSEGHGLTVMAASSLANKNLALRRISGIDLSRQVCLHTIFGSCKTPVISSLERFASRFEWTKAPLFEEPIAHALVSA